ncbi:MAG TPA: DUF5924 family protein [Gammaproteobacteria bacterium]|nr:DUF5924 family protein [Gammaproteobacteria bacterium]
MNVPLGDAPRVEPPAQTITRTTWLERLKRLSTWHARVPWLLPLTSFVAGWIGFVMVRRGADWARLIAMLALLGWPWLLIEPIVRRLLERRRRRLGRFVANFVSQSLQQELLFFSLPFVLGATQWDAGQIAFASLVGSAALVSTIDPLYERLVAKRASRRLLFHAYCSWIAALVVLPMVLLVPLEKALPLSLGTVVVWLVLTFPLSWRSLRTWPARAAWLASVIVVPIVVWELRAQVPAAGLAVMRARITQSIEGLDPGPAVSTIARSTLDGGVVAFAVIRAPAGLTQTVIFEWHHGDQSERIPETIHGGRGEGWRAYSRKQRFPEDSLGAWTVDLLTPQGQLLKRLHFDVVDR